MVCEQRIYGLPLNRIHSRSLVISTLSDARQAMFRLYLKTLNYVSLTIWLEDITLTFKSSPTLPCVYGTDVKHRILTVAKLLSNRLVNESSNSYIYVPTAITHGDFQPGNIFAPYNSLDCTVHIIDWEYSSRRCIWYDAMVFELRSRFPAGLHRRINAWLNDCTYQESSLKWCLTDDHQINSFVCIFTVLLDDLLLRLLETSIPTLRKQDVGLLCFLDELNLFLSNQI